MRKTKIVCTLGPAVDDPNILKTLMKKGMNVARMNFSHGNHDEHKRRIKMFKEIRDELNLPIPLLLDTKGPEIRLKKFTEGQVELNDNDSFSIINKDIIGNTTKCSVTYKDLHKDVIAGGSILINDGLVELKIDKIENKDVHCTVLNGGIIGDNKGINVPDTEIDLPSLTEQDIKDLIFGIENGFDLIAASFIRKARDVIEIKKVLENNGAKDIKVIAKIENRQGLQNIDEILKVSDGIMVARGDLGVEIPVEDVPIAQKMLIKKCYKCGKPVITATQMLDSMIRYPRPTRAETSDVANAIYDGTSAIMLSGETAIGKYPLESLQVMARVAEKAENSIDYWGRFKGYKHGMTPSVTNAISHATCDTSHNLNASAIISVTSSGHTARMISRFRPACPIITTTISKRVCRQLSLSWGVFPYLVDKVATTDELFDSGVDKALECGMVNNGDLVVITAGVPTGISGTTNLMKVHIVGKVLVQGTGVNPGTVTNEICVVENAEDAKNKFNDGNIIVAPITTNEMMPYIQRASALIVEQGGVGSHASVAGLALDIPVIVEADNATKILKTGSVVTVDSHKGLIYYGSVKV